MATTSTKQADTFIRLLHTKLQIRQADSCIHGCKLCQLWSCWHENMICCWYCKAANTAANRHHYAIWQIEFSSASLSLLQTNQVKRTSFVMLDILCSFCYLVGNCHNWWYEDVCQQVYLPDFFSNLITAIRLRVSKQLVEAVHAPNIIILSTFCAWGHAFFICARSWSAVEEYVIFIYSLYIWCTICCNRMTESSKRSCYELCKWWYLWIYIHVTFAVWVEMTGQLSVECC